MTILAVYGLVEAEAIQDFLEEKTIPCARIRTPEWVKEKDCMFCNHAIELNMDVAEIKTLLEHHHIQVRDIFTGVAA